MYFLFHENLHSARLFLISTLQGPIIKVIGSADIYLDADPDRAIMRFSAEEIKEKFGIPGTPEYDKKIAEYRSEVICTLVDFANAFILSLHENVFCFPSALGWLIWQIGKMMGKSFGDNSKEVTNQSINEQNNHRSSSLKELVTCLLDFFYVWTTVL